MTRYSLAEIDAQSRKAARGAGYTWGLSEEAGQAVRWLEAHDLQGVAALARLLTVQDGLAYQTLCPTSIEGVWQADGGKLCPLIAGVTLADHAFLKPPTLGIVREPLLLIPFLVRCGHSHAKVPRLELGGDWNSSSSGEMAVDFSTSSLKNEEISLKTSMPQGREIDPNVWSTLDRFAYRTYVPATEASRAGAGAGTSDND